MRAPGGASAAAAGHNAVSTGGHEDISGDMPLDIVDTDLRPLIKRVCQCSQRFFLHLISLPRSQFGVHTRTLMSDRCRVSVHLFACLFFRVDAVACPHPLILARFCVWFCLRSCACRCLPCRFPTVPCRCRVVCPTSSIRKHPDAASLTTATNTPLSPLSSPVHTWTHSLVQCRS